LIGSTFNGANFLTVSAQTGTAPTQITLGVLPENLPDGGATAGVYTGQLLFLAAGSTVTVPISVSVGDAESDRTDPLSFAKASPDARSTPFTGANLWPANTINVICGGFNNNNARIGAFTTAPDGTTTAPLIIEANPLFGAQEHYEYIFPDLGVGQQTLSFHFQAGGDSWVYIRSQVDGAVQRVWFNLVGSGAVGINVPAGWTPQIASLGNGWYRCAVTFSVAQSALYSGFGLATSDQQFSYTGTDVNGVYQWGQQFEHGTLSAYQANVGPCMSFSKTASASSVASGSPIAYTIALRNNAAPVPGTGTATATALNDPLPGGTGINWSISPSYNGPGTCAISGAVGSQTLACSFGDLAGGGIASVRIASSTSASSCAAYSNTATASATNISSMQASATTTVQCPSLNISKTHTGNFTQGQNGATYSLTVSNTGAGPTSGTVTVTEVVPTGLTLASMSGLNWNCSGNTCTRGDVLAAGASYPAISVTVNVASNAPSLLTNQVTVSGGGSAIASASDPTTVAPPACTVALTPPNTLIDYSGGDGLTFGLATSAAGCAWTVTTPVGWLKALPDTGTGNGTIFYSVYPNYSSVTRVAALGVGGQSFTITQTGAPGTPDERFVQLLYFNFYGRRPSASEVAFQVTNGVDVQGRAQVALNFFNGSEFLNGGRFITGLYFGLLGRAPDYNGFVFQRNAMVRNIVDPLGLIANFINGAEFQLKYGTLTDTAFVTLLYNQILLRPPDPQGLAAQVAGIQLYGRTQIAYNMLNSPEFQITTGPQMSAYLLYACLLQRDATLGETNALVSQIQQGTTFLSLISNFVASAEFNALVL
jgi:uncharacterized repeat protein (TIGR01451 family)